MKEIDEKYYSFEQLMNILNALEKSIVEERVYVRSFEEAKFNEGIETASCLAQNAKLRLAKVFFDDKIGDQER